jgi:hypothetical protein
MEPIPKRANVALAVASAEVLGADGPPVALATGSAALLGNRRLANSRTRYKPGSP